MTQRDHLPSLGKLTFLPRGVLSTEKCTLNPILNCVYQNLFARIASIELQFAGPDGAKVNGGADLTNLCKLLKSFGTD